LVNLIHIRTIYKRTYFTASTDMIYRTRNTKIYWKKISSTRCIQRCLLKAPKNILMNGSF